MTVPFSSVTSDSSDPYLIDLLATHAQDSSERAGRGSSASLSSSLAEASSAY